MSNQSDTKNMQAAVLYKSILYVNIKDKWEHGASYCEGYKLFFVNSGKLRLWCTPGHLEINEGCAIVLSPHTRIRSGYSGSDGIEFFEVSFDSNNPFFKIAAAVPVCSSSIVCELLKALYMSKLSPDFKHDAKNALLYSILHQMYGNIVPATIRERELLNMIFLYVENNLLHDFDFDDLQRTLGLDRSHISRVFSKAVGKTLKAYVNERRVLLACDMLASSSFDINKIASLMGFEESNLFTKFFTYHTGMTPSDYRRSIYGTKSVNG